MTIDEEAYADLQEICSALSEGRRPDYAVTERVKARAEKAREELFRRHGITDIAVQLVRESRDQPRGWMEREESE